MLEALILTVPRLPNPVLPRDVELVVMKQRRQIGQTPLVLYLMHILLVLLKRQGLVPIVTIRTPIMEKQNLRSA